MGEKTAGVGHFQIPTAPAAGVSVTSGTANTYTTSAVQLIASTSSAIFITGLYVEEAAVSAGTYVSVQLMTGTAGSETTIGQYLVGPSTGSTVTRTYRAIYPFVPVATTTRIAAKTADSVGSIARLVSLEVIAVSNVVDDGVAVGTVTTVTNQLTAAQIATGVWTDTTAGDFTTASSVGKSVMNGVALGTGLTVARCTLTDTLTTYTGNTVQTGDSFARIGAAGAGLTALGDTRVANLDATVSSRMASYTQPTGFLAATFPTTVASPTNITAASGVSLAASQHVIVDSGTVTTLTNLPAIPAAWLTATGIAASALNGKGDWLLSSSYTAPLTAATTRTALGMASANLDTQLATLLPTASYTAPDNATIAANAVTAAAIKLKTDSLTFTTPGKVDAGLYYVNGVAITGLGTDVSPWKAA